VKPTESRDRGGKMMRAFSQNKALNFPLLFFLVVFIFNLKNLCIMKHKHFVTFNQEHFMGFTCFETTISYHFISKTELSILRIDQSLFGSDDYEETILFKLDHPVKNEISGLNEFLTDLFSFRGNLHGNPWFEKSEVITESEFNEIKKQGSKRMNDRNNKIKEIGQNHPLIMYCTQKNLYPEPEGDSPHGWKANCPSGRQHHIMISTSSPDSHSWGCGYCKKKGGIEELKNWVENK
jgi:hypothetical protein